MRYVLILLSDICSVVQMRGRSLSTSHWLKKEVTKALKEQAFPEMETTYCILGSVRVLPSLQ